MKPLIIGALVCTFTASYAIAGSDKLSGNWDGLRTTASDNGVTVDAEYTHYYQANVVNDSKHNSAHRFDVFLNLDTEKLGLWEGGSFHTQGIMRRGTANEFGIVALPTNSAFYGSEENFISSLYYQHSFEDWRLFAGKIDAFELGRHGAFYGGVGRHGFMNIAFSAPPSGVTPPAFLGALAMFNWQNINWSAMLYDPRDRYSSNIDFSDPFSDGVNVSLSGTYTTKVAGRATSFGVSTTYSTEEGIDLSSISEDDKGDITITDVARNKYNIRVQATHNLVEQDDDSSKAWGVYARLAFADGNPNLFSSTFAGGLGGQAIFAQRPQDNWGVGYYYHNFSVPAQKAINAIEPGMIGDEQGVEFYYAAKLLPWLTVTADAQWVDTVINSDKDAWILGLRTNIVF
jgi:porin